MTTDPHDKSAEREFAREADAAERSEIERIDAKRKAEEQRLAAAYTRAPARSGGPAHIARPMARR